MSEYFCMNCDKFYTSSIRLQVATQGNLQTRGGYNYISTTVWLKVNGKERNSNVREYLDKLIKTLGGTSVDENLSVSDMSGYNKRYSIRMYSFDDPNAIRDKDVIDSYLTSKIWRGGYHYGNRYDGDNYIEIHHLVDIHEEGLDDQYAVKCFNQMCSTMMKVCDHLL